MELVKNFACTFAFGLVFLLGGCGSRNADNVEMFGKNEQLGIFAPAAYGIKVGETTEYELMRRFSLGEPYKELIDWIEGIETISGSAICDNLKTIVLMDGKSGIKKGEKIVVGVGKESKKVELVRCEYDENMSEDSFNLLCDKLAHRYRLFRVDTNNFLGRVSYLFDSKQQLKLRVTAYKDLKIITYISPKAAPYVTGGTEFLHKTQPKIFYPESFGINLKTITADEIKRKYKIIFDKSNRKPIFGHAMRLIRFFLKYPNTEHLPIATAVFYVTSGKLKQLEFEYFPEDGTSAKFQQELSAKYKESTIYPSYDKGSYLISVDTDKDFVSLIFMDKKFVEQTMKDAMKKINELSKKIKEIGNMLGDDDKRK